MDWRDSYHVACFLCGLRFATIQLCFVYVVRKAFIEPLPGNALTCHSINALIVRTSNGLCYICHMYKFILSVFEIFLSHRHEFPIRWEELEIMVPLAGCLVPLGVPVKQSEKYWHVVNMFANFSLFLFVALAIRTFPATLKPYMSSK
jgi:hypothetical protein